MKFKGNLLIIGLLSTILIFGWFFYHFKNRSAQQAQRFQFMSYWFSWATNSPDYIIKRLCEVPTGVNTVLVAFALEKPDHSGLTLQLSNYNQFTNDIHRLHSRGIKVLLSTGGANGEYPWLINALSDEVIANQYISFLNEYHFDGLDFDIEKGDSHRLPHIIELIKTALPKLIISVTIASAGQEGISASYNKLLREIYLQKNLNFINLMNYNHFTLPHASNCTYENNDLSHNCYIHNLKAASSKTQTWTNDSTIAKQLIANTMMIGYAEDKRSINPQLASTITQWLQKNGYAAIVTWGLNRDQPSCTEGKLLDSSTGMEGITVGAFTNAIINAI